MAWVRYDDQFYANPKVTAVVAEDPGALALHVLANTWSNGQKLIGHIPAHQPGFLLCDRTLGQKWAELLVRYGLWHEVASIVDCLSCFEAYPDVDYSIGGYVIHDSHKYRAPARERTTPGTAAELSEKRREAGRKGGRASAARRNQTKTSKDKQSEAKHQARQASEAKTGDTPTPEAPEGGPVVATSDQMEIGSQRPAKTRQGERASQANSVSKTSNLLLAGVSPEPEPEPLFASNEAKVPPSAGADDPRADAEVTAGTIVGEWIERCAKRPPGDVIGQVSKRIKAMLDEDIHPDDIRRGIASWMAKGLHPSTLPSVVNEVMNASTSRNGPPNGSGSQVPERTVYDASKVFKNRKKPA